MRLILGRILVGIAIVCFVILSFVVTKSPNESFSRDIFGLPIPIPPVWISFIPYLGWFVGFVFEFFSLHGLAEMFIFVIFLGVGMKLIIGQEKNFDYLRKNSTKRQEKEKISLGVQNEFRQKTKQGQVGLFDNDPIEKYFKIMGEIFQKEEFPILLRWSEKNPQTLEDAVRNVAEKWHNGDIASACQALESDLQHG